MNRRIFALAVAALVLFAAAPIAPAQNVNLDFKLVNRTGVEINAVYLAPHDSDDWGDDVMGQDTLPNGQSVDIQFHPKAKARLWDLRVEDSDGNPVEWDSLDLSQIEVLTLKLVKGKPVAEWK
jgi:hypothetical protein